MSAAELKSLQDTSKYVTQCLSVGKYTYSELSPILTSISTLAIFAKRLAKENSNPPADMVKLSEDLENLSTLLYSGFEKLNALMFEHPFFLNLTHDISMVTFYLQDTIEEPDNEALENFKQILKKYQPMQMVTKLIDYLLQDSTNPMKKQQKVEDEEDEETRFSFDQKLAIVDGIFAQLLFLETYSSGILLGGSTINTKKMKERIEKIQLSYIDWRTQVLRDDPSHPALPIIKYSILQGGYDFPRVSETLGTIATVGNDVRLAVSTPEVYKEKLGGLEVSMKELWENVMNPKFNEQKAFMEANGFYEQFVKTSERLDTSMRKAIANPTSPNILEFQNIFNSNPPQTIVFNLLSTLKNDSTNILKKAMLGDKFRSEETFDKWQKIIDGIFAFLVFVECFKSGLFGGSNLSSAENLKNSIQNSYRQDLQTWKSEFKTSYWPAIVRSLVSEVQQQNLTTTDNSILSLAINSSLMKIMTDDVFLIYVYNNGSGPQKHSYNGNENSLLTFFGVGNKNVIVTRSRYIRGRTDDMQNVFEAQFERVYFQQRPSTYDAFLSSLAQKNSVGSVVMVNESEDLSLISSSLEFLPAFLSSIEVYDTPGETAPKDAFFVTIGYY